MAFNHSYLYVGLVVVIVAVISLFSGFFWGRRSVKPEIVTKTEYSRIYLQSPVATTSYNTKSLIFVPFEDIRHQIDTTYIHDGESPADSVFALPEQMVEYRDSALVRDDIYLHYEIGVRGYRPSLAYANFCVPYTTTTQTVVPKRRPQIRFTVGAVCGGGYGFINKQADIFAGVGIGFGFVF